MKNLLEIKLTMLLTMLIMIPLSLSSQNYCNSNPVDVHGGLSVSGNKIVDKNGAAVSFAGNSFFWSNTGWGAEKYYNSDVVSWLKDDWNSTLVRAAMGVEDNGGYLSDPNGNKQRLRAVVDAAIAEDMYVIIDWHSHHAEDYQQEAIDFFTEMATLYGNTPNVIYEIYNEPLQVSWSNTIKPYAEAVIAAIRSVDPDNLIIVGTPTWSQDVDAASNDPITGYSNIAYTLHFYSGTHTQYLRDKAQTALNNGIALFVTEWGTVNADGDGGVANASTDDWMSFLAQNDISHANWSINDKAEGASALNPGASANGGWSNNDLTASGNKVKDIITNWEQYCNDSGGNPPPAGGDGNITVRARGVNGDEMMNVLVDGVVVGTFTLGTSYEDYSVEGSPGVVTIDYINDSTSRDMQVDYITVDGVTCQAEDQAVNTGVWQGQCGGSYSEWIHCPGYIEFPGCQGNPTNPPTPGNEAPSVSITAPGNNSTFTAGDVVTINASANDSDGSVTSVEFFVDGTSIGVDNSASYSVDWTPSAGTYSLTAIATDDDGASSVSSTVNVTIEGSSGSGCNGLPTWTASDVYANAGTQVVYNGNIYENNWYSQNQNPEQNSGQWDVWTLVGSCSAAKTSANLERDYIFRVFPNPASDFVNISIGTTEGFNKVSILDLRGQVVIEKATNSKHSIKISLEGLSEGVYFIKMSGDKNYSKLFVKTN